MMRVFADTYYFIGLLSPDDEAHERCVAISKRTDLDFVTTSWVFTELCDGVARTAKRKLMKKFIKRFAESQQNLLVATTDELFEQGLALYDARHDKDWSLTDCISFVVMQEHNLTDALTGDHHFTQAGFNCLLQ